MEPRSFIVFLSSILITVSGIAQHTPSIEPLREKYNTHFQQARESVHLHLNKTTFLVGEEVWWSAYAYTKKNNSPSFETTNLYCGIYDQDGKQVRKELFLMEQGKANGSFPIDNELPSGTYFIKASTSWMKNFKENLDFVQKITIINETLEPEKETTPVYDVQILPEGGHLIQEVLNTVGIRITNQNGKGIKISKGEVINQDNETITSFYSNDFGVGKFELTHKKGTTYKIKITLANAQTLEKELPKAKDKGITLTVNNILDNKLVVSLKTNEQTLEDIKNTPFYLAIHRDGLMTLNSFTFDEASTTINISKDKLLSGTNIITLFNANLEPISERLIFNYTNINIANVIVEKPQKKVRDSISFKINVFSKNNTPTSLSVSALPASTMAHSPQNDIVSNFLLLPYLKSRVEDPGRYFKDITRKKEFELDLVLLTQGWSSYDWRHIFGDSKEMAHPFEIGITVEGKLNSKIRKEDQLVVNQGNIDSMLFLDLEEQTDFSITNILLKQGDTIQFSLKGKKGGLRKPDLEIDFMSDLKFVDAVSPHDRTNALFTFDPISMVLEDVTVPKSFVQENTITLDEVVVTETKELTRKSPLITNFFRGFKIGEEESKISPLLTDFIRRKGFQVTISTGVGQVFIANPRPFSGPVAVYIDDFLVRDGNDLFNIPLNRIDEIYIEKDGFSGDSNASGGTIRIYKKEGSNGNDKSSFAEKLVTNSFTRSKEFYRPKYGSFLSKEFIDFGIVHWAPKLVTDKEGSVTVKLPNNDVSNIKIFVEGMGNDGALVSHMQEISLE